MYSKNFKRIEKKYLLTEEEKNEILKRISPYIEKDKYHETTIGNIYFDTEHNDLIIHSIDKPLFKEKIRVRCYGTPTLDDEVFLELKSKYMGVVGKRRVKLTLRELYDFIDNDKYDKNNQIMKEIAYHYKHYQVYPKIYVAYDRKSYKGIEDEGLRITFDSNLRSRRKDLKLESGDYGEEYFETPKYIMEIKTLGSLPLWFIKILTELKIYPKSFSKYGNIYKKESGVKC